MYVCMYILTSQKQTHTQTSPQRTNIRTALTTTTADFSSSWRTHTHACTACMYVHIYMNLCLLNSSDRLFAGPASASAAAARVASYINNHTTHARCGGPKLAQPQLLRSVVVRPAVGPAAFPAPIVPVCSSPLLSLSLSFTRISTFARCPLSV